jgi:hypothetical protein
MITAGGTAVGRVKETEESGRQLAVMDLRTGEYEPAITWVRQKWKGETFFMGFQEAFAELAKRPLGSEAKNVFLFILGRVDYDNRLTIPQVEIARQLGMHRQNVSRAVATLVREQVLLVEEPLLGRNRRLRLNDRYGWKGKLKNLRTRRKSAGKAK